MPKVSVIMTSYNRPRLLRDAIDSMLDQTYEDFELIVADDGSSPATLASINNYTDPRIVKLFLGRRELDGARYCHSINAALDVATGGLISYLTDDDFYLPRRLEVMVKELALYPDKFIVYGRQIHQFLDVNMQVLREYVRPGPEDPTLGRVTGVVTRDMKLLYGHMDQNSVMHRASCLERLTKPYWPTHNWGAGDAEFWKRLIPYWDFYPIDEVLDVHREHPNGANNKSNSNRPHVYVEDEI